MSHPERIRLLASAAMRFSDRRLRCIGAIDAGGVCDAFNELPCADGVGDIRGYVLPGNWRCQIGGGLNNVRGIRSADKEERHGSIWIENDVRDSCGIECNGQSERRAD